MEPSGGGLHPVRPYAALAPVYGRVMAHVDYAGWWNHLWRLGRKYGGGNPGRILELGAGACPFVGLENFPRDAFSVHTDVNPGMLAQCQPGDAPPPLRTACSMDALPFRGGFDWVLLVYDALNYQLEEAGVERTFREALSVLRPGGIFLFDVTTAANSLKHFDDTLDYEDMGDCVVLRASSYDPEAAVQTNEFTLFVREPDGRYRGLRETHRQKVYPAETLRTLAVNTGFEVKAVLADFSHRPGSDRHERLHFVLQKPRTLSGTPA